MELLGIMTEEMDMGNLEGVLKMNTRRSDAGRYVLAASLGAIGGALVVAVAAKAIPKMMSQIMSGMMQEMMGQMRKSGCNPAEM